MKQIWKVKILFPNNFSGLNEERVFYVNDYGDVCELYRFGMQNKWKVSHHVDHIQSVKEIMKEIKAADLG